MQFKRPISLFLAGVLTAGLCTASVPALSFSDTENHAARAAIETFAQLGVLKGYEDDTFRPDRTVTRAELCAVLDRTFGYRYKAKTPFADVEAGAWYADAVLRLKAEGILRGDGDGNARPNAPVSWEEALTMISRAFDLPQGGGAGLPEGGLSGLSPWAVGHVAALYGLGYLAGVEIKRPQDPFTRADVVNVLNNIITHRGWEAAGRMVVNGALIPYGDYHFYPGDFREENGRVFYTGTEAKASYGIDVSAHQGEIDWQAVAADGAEFAMIRLGYRGYTVGNVNEDAYFEANMEGALAAGLKVGVYFFSQAITVEEALEEARFTLKLLEPYRDKISFPVVYDWEDIGRTDARTYKLDRDVLDACALAFCGEIEGAGYQPMIYFYQYLGEERYHLDAIDQYPFWYCHYKTNYPNLERPFRMWQYTSSGKINGVEGEVDWNICFEEY